MNDPELRKELSSIVKDIKAYIKAERECGIGEIAIPASFGRENPKALNKQSSSRSEALTQIKSQALNCRRCPLCRTRKNVVFGDGDPGAKLMFVGEAPGYDEDLQGLPFVGRAGQLLTKMIEAMHLSRDKVYICNVLKCRPPENRSPLPEEVSRCKEYLLKQIEIITPAVICCLGKHASQALLETETPISRLRGREFDFNGIVLIPTYHPAYLLRNPDSKRESWEDLKKIKRILAGS